MLLGGSQTGKSSCGNTILRRRSFCTSVSTTSCREDRAQVFGRSLAVLDTPACFSLTPDLLEPARVHLLVVNVSSAFGDSQEEALEKQLEAAGAGVWSRAVVLFSHGDWLGPTSVERRVESEGEALRRLLEKCGNRYHVLDNKHWGGGAQVEELMELLEQMLMEDRPDVLRGGDGVCSAEEPQTEKSSRRSRLAPTCGWSIYTPRGPFHRRSYCLFLSFTVTEPGTPSSALVPLTSSDTGGQMVPLGAVGRAGLSSRGAGHRHRLRWNPNLLVCFSADHLHLRTNESLLDRLSPRRPRMLLALPPSHPRASADPAGVGARSLCHLQALIDGWDRSSLEELEAFIDLYFEMVWEQSLGPPEFPELEEQSGVKTGDEEVLLSIDRKLSKLELLEDIQKELKELRTSLEHSWKLTEELREHKHDKSDT